MIWTILGIDETKDKRAITRAYREKLQYVNPEEKPEQFKELRAAYEQAIRFAEQEDLPEEEKSEADLWTEKLTDIYESLQARISIDDWRSLLQEDFCQALDTRPLAEEALMKFLMQRFQIPHAVMQYLNEEFAFTERIEELQEKYPKDFLQYVILDRINYEDNIPMELFEPGLDGNAADRYMSLYRKALNTSPEEAGDLYEEMQKVREQHPYGEALICKVRMVRGDEEAFVRLEELSAEYPEDIHLKMDLMLAMKARQQMERLETLAREILAKRPANQRAREFLAEALAARGAYKDATILMNDLLQESIGDIRYYYELEDKRRNMNRDWMQQLEEKIAQNPEDIQSKYDLAWCYMDTGNMERTRELADQLPLEQPDPFGYYNLKAIVANDSGDHEQGFLLESRLLEVTRAMEPDGTSQTEKRMKRTAEILLRMSESQHEMRQKDKAIELAEQALVDPNLSHGQLMQIAHLFLRMEEYPRSVELTERFLKEEPYSAAAHHLRAYLYYQMGRDNLAFEAINTALELDSSALAFYELKTLILVRNDAFEPAQEIITMLEENGVTENLTIRWCKISMYQSQHEEDHVQEELDEILKLAAMVDAALQEEKAADVPDWAGQFYHTYASLTADRQNFNKEYPVEPLIEILDRGIAMDPKGYACRSYKAWLLKKSKRWEEALALFQELEQLPRNSCYIEAQIAELYYQRLERYPEEALHYYKLLIQNDPEDADLHFYAGMAAFRLERLEEAEQEFRKEQELAPDDIDGYFRLAQVLLKQNRLEEALEQAEKVLTFAREREEKDTVRFWDPKIKALSRMERYSEAVEALEECAERNPKWDKRKRLFALYLQANMLEEAEKLVNQWKFSFNDPKGWTTAKAELLEVQQKYNALALHMLNGRKDMDERIAYKADLYLAAQKGNLKKYRKLVEQNLSAKEKKGEITGGLLGEYAMTLWIVGEAELARVQAAKALELLDEECKEFHGSRLITQCKRLPMLALLGRVEEARAEEKRLAKQPLCEVCDYHSCKDLAIFRAELELVLGNIADAMEIIRFALKEWPDEQDFLTLKFLIQALEKH